MRTLKPTTIMYFYEHLQSFIEEWGNIYIYIYIYLFISVNNIYFGFFRYSLLASLKFLILSLKFKIFFRKKKTPFFIKFDFAGF